MILHITFPMEQISHQVLTGSTEVLELIFCVFKNIINWIKPVFKPVFEIPSSLARGGGGADVYCNVCDGENASDCRNRQRGRLQRFLQMQNTRIF